MGTRSTVKFYEEQGLILSVYQQYDGYPGGVGQQIVSLIDKYTLVNGIGFEEKQPIANGFSDLALFYILENKDGAGNLYATSAEDAQEYNYEIYGRFAGEIQAVKVIHEFGETRFFDNYVDFKNFVEENS